ncbi:casein kinase II subunit alpha'-interacting protein isoform X1 [Peromyscus eremicus]|uniref:casein kinase II subunit alpha'-interacting protein isoform X1 n=1 Tax=Peromyscus eremicus TaxID=42410 RepID=UPI0027DC47BE|nr:casein kinase II subunit alpha'-interacting protein isoform X1 [Peromyscus eremicus]XP_059132764.1 casein kinase II subunit alpha'-interacting protein isoform X1 [Peromyscus eremicus]XP_059132765.1 casein kinase II subunit alpha'-interacting protein isoform X1 [Peromyscus eremicus]XP_059132766.1 casein kinase II subunit alpha'-interacting protein isoform X1 [Peromyscus eremicus]
MVPLAYHDQDFVHLDNSQQQTTNNSVLNQFTSQPVTKEQSQNTVTVPPSSFNKKAQSFSTLPSPNSKVRQRSSTRGMKSSSLYSKHPQKDPYSKSSLNPSWKSLDSSLPHHKPQTTSSSSFSSTSSSEPSQISVRSRLPLPKPQTSSGIDLCWKSSSLESTQRVSTSTSSSLQYQETPSLNIIWTSPSLESSPSEPNTTLCRSRSQKESSLDCLWSSLLESSQKTLSSPPFNQKLQRNDSPSTLSSLESSRTAQNSTLPDCKPLKSPASNSNNNVLSLPLSQVKSRKPPLLAHSTHPSHSLPVYQPKPKTVLKGDHSTRVLSSPVCQSKVQSTTSPKDKHRARQLPSVHPKPNISGQRASSPKLCTKNKNASVPSSRLQSKGNVEQSLKTEAENEVPWSLDYSHPCIIKGGTVPVDVVNKIVNSISKSTIQKDLSRQILFRRMRGKPNPRPGPRLSSTYTVCLECGSCIKSQCSHLTGKKDPRCATLFVIPTPESRADGKVDVKIVLILSLPEASSSCYQLPMKDDQPEDNSEALDGNLEELEKITHFFPASESDFIQGIKTNQKWLAVSSEDRDISQEPQAVDWLLYVKNRNTVQPQAPVQAPSSSSSSSCSSYSSSSSSSSTGFPSSSSPCKDPTPAPLPSYVLAKVRSHHRLPPGVSWLEFIRGTSSETTKVRQPALPKTKRVRTRNTKTMKKGKKGTNTLLRYLQTKFQNEKS